MMTSRSFQMFFACAVMLLHLIAHTADAAPSRLDALIEEARTHNPRIQASFDQWKATEHAITPSRSLPDPVFSYGYFGKPVETRVGPMQHQFGASQHIPFPAKLQHRGKVSEETSQISEQGYQATARDVVWEVKQTYYDIFWADRAIGVIEEEKAILENLEVVARKRYEADLTQQQDVVKAQVAISQLMTQLVTQQESRKALVARLNGLLNREAGTPLSRITDMGYAPIALTLPQLKTFTLESKQELLGAQHAVQRAKHERTLAKLDYVPDFTVGFDYTMVGQGPIAGPDNGSDAVVGKFSMTVPIWFPKLRAHLSEKQKALEASQRVYDNTEQMAIAEIEALYHALKSHQDVLKLYRTAIIPQTEQSFDASRIAYEAGEVDFLNWLDAERSLLQARLGADRAMVDYMKTKADLERAVGQDL